MRKLIVSFIILNVTLIIGMLFTPYAFGQNNEYYSYLKDDVLLVSTQSAFTNDEINRIKNIAEIQQYDFINPNMYFSTFDETNVDVNNSVLSSSSLYYNPNYFNDIKLTQGRMIENKDEILVSQTMADLYQKLYEKSIVNTKVDTGDTIVGVYQDIFDAKVYNYYNQYSLYAQALAYKDSYTLMDQGILTDINYQVLSDTYGLNVNYICEQYCYLEQTNLTQEQKDAQYTLDEFPKYMYNQLYIKTSNPGQVIEQLKAINPNYLIVTNNTDFKDNIPSTFYIYSAFALILLNVLVFLPPFYRNKYSTFRIRKK